jgi:hypothetical protein
MEMETTRKSFEPKHKLQTEAISRFNKVSCYEDVVENGIIAGF